MNIKSIKGTDAYMCCLKFQFEPGKTYSLPEGESVKICGTGFHACPVEQHPLSVFKFYPPAGSRYFDVIQSGDMQHDGDKTASQTIEIGPEISIPDLVQRAVDFVKATETAKIGSHATGYQGAASATGYQGAASATGTQGAASATGNKGAASATGNKGAASATGYQGAASATGNKGAASATGALSAASATGEQGAASATGAHGAASATGYRGAASATGEQGAASATGYQGAASATGTQGAASATGSLGAASATGSLGAASATGHRGAASATGTHGAASATGECSAAMATGIYGRVMGGIDGVSLFAREIIWADGKYNLASVACGITGRDGIKAGIWYVCKNGKLVEAE